MRITKRDIDILTAIASFQVLTTLQISNLLFPSLHRTRKRLTILNNYGLIRRFRQAIQIGLGSSQFIYEISNKGFRVLASECSNNNRCSSVNTPNKPLSPLFLEHTLQRNEFRIALTLACARQSDAELLSWNQGNSVRKTVNLIASESNSGWKRVSIIADGHFGIKFDNKIKTYFVEIDRGTMSHRRLLEKARAYVQLLRQYSRSSNYSSLPFRLLLVTTSEVRLREFFLKLNKTNWLFPSGFVMGTTYERISSSNQNIIMSCIWDINTTKGFLRVTLNL